ncbi:hypothetical protein DFH07DRAFT_948145 [Mycena maculata]|uniref:Uncharacterized protein n=1 Tax=Mycena maculata TaxID=230809 RepID=A0AAD7KGE4_9AGAR|nr:hypothetical protein DFH07DRAFT_948145 [Mycena maculata]
MASSTTSNAGVSATQEAIHFLNSAILPVLHTARAGVTGVGAPVEPIISGVLEVATMVSTMHSNKEDLSKLEESLTKLIALDVPGLSEDLQARITKLSSNLKLVAIECKSLAKKSSFKHFVKSKNYKDRIEGVKNVISSHLRDFTFYSNISIEKSVQSIQEAVGAIEPKVDNVHAKQILANLKCVPAR